MISTLNLTVDGDNARPISRSGYPEALIPRMWRGTTWVLRLSIQRSFSDATASRFYSADEYVATLDDTFGPTNIELVTVPDTDFNQYGDWSEVSPEGGKICLRLPLTDAQFALDLGANKEKTYQLQVWAINEDDESVIIMDTPVTITNVAVEP